MQTISGSSNWKLIIRRELEGITILRAETCDIKAALPDELFGLPVTVLGDHALAPGGFSSDGEQVTITCGVVAADAEWNNRKLRELTLPNRLKLVMRYALMSCDSLCVLRLHDGIESWHTGALMNCHKLNKFHITRVSEHQGETLEYLNHTISHELDVTITEQDGQTCRLLFPEYIEFFEENWAARNFDINIEGGGYPYHHCFRNKQIQMIDYDGLWKKFLGREHDNFCALRIAWWRLRYPVGLNAAAKQDYIEYLKNHSAEAIYWLLGEKDNSGLLFLLEMVEADKDTLIKAGAIAREERKTEALAILLEEQHKRFPVGMNKSFDL